MSDENRDAFRQHFAAVFSDFFLFDEMMGIQPAGSVTDELISDYLQKLQLDHQFKIENGVLSTIELSQGQRKRLALLHAYIEDRPIYLFDEWAADQDPSFKKIFYNQLLPDLKARSKTIIVISHDDQYYSVADRMIKLNYGRLVFDRITELHNPFRVSSSS